MEPIVNPPATVDVDMFVTARFVIVVVPNDADTVAAKVVVVALVVVEFVATRFVAVRLVTVASADVSVSITPVVK